MKKIGMISLGCAKNLVDAEIMMGHLRQSGMELTADSKEADVLIVNTCAFIDSAKEESIEAIFDAHKQKGLSKKSADQKLIVAGCMSQRFSKELSSEMPEVDAFIGLDQLTEVSSVVERIFEKDQEGEDPLNLVTKRPTYIPDYDTPRFRLTPSHSAYVKIAEGCNHPCSFCVIPQMRGKHRSRTIDSVVREARQLVAEGVKELNLISQDTTYFGMDRWEERVRPTTPVDSSRGDSLVHLLEELDQIEGDFWIRILYTHPAHWSQELVKVIAQSKKIARYIDMPLQHIHDEMLKTMRRETSGQHIRDLVQMLREGIPDIALRTTFIVGFPGEKDEHFETLLDFINEVKFERLGVFQYSQEEGSRAAKMEDQIPANIRKLRWNKAMKAQQKIAKEISASQVGKTLKVLAESETIGRSEADAPDIDGRIKFRQKRTPGEFTQVTISGHEIYDLLE